jgi:hypothetical protein
MGSLSGTKAPAKRPLPPDVEATGSINARLLDFWNSAIIPLLLPSSLASPHVPNTSEAMLSPVNLRRQRVNSRASEVPAVLIVSHGATISKLIHDILLRGYGYALTCDISRRAIYNTSTSILRMDAHEVVSQNHPNLGTADSDEDIRPSISVTGELLVFASIAHLIQKDVVKENADMLEQRSS